MNAHAKSIVLVTRASHQAGQFIGACEGLGYDTVHIPCIEIHPIDCSLTLGHIENTDLVLFTSVNAIEQAHRLQPLPWSSTATGIGEVSTAKLHELGQTLIQQPKPPFNSEGFVAQLNPDTIKKLLVIKGKGGRDTIAKACEAKGIEYRSVDVYERRLPILDKDTVNNQLREKWPDIICATSNEVLENLLKLIPAERVNELIEIPLIVNSDRGEEAARKLGFTGTISVASPPGDQGQLSLLKNRLLA